MFGGNTASATQTGSAERGSFFKSFVKDGKDAKPASPFAAQAKPAAAPQKVTFAGMAAKTAETQQTQADKTPPASPLKKGNVNIPFDISKLTLEEKLAVLERINADIENETKNKRVLQPTAARTAAPAQPASQAARPTATQLFKSARERFICPNCTSFCAAGTIL